MNARIPARRDFLKGILAACAAPAFIPVERLMRIKPLILPEPIGFTFYNWIENGFQVKVVKNLVGEPKSILMFPLGPEPRGPADYVFHYPPEVVQDVALVAYDESEIAPFTSLPFGVLR